MTSLPKTDDELMFEQFVARYFDWKQKNLVEKQQNLANADDVEILESNEYKQSQDSINKLYDQEARKCSQVVEILRDDIQETLEESTNNSIPELLKQWRLLTKNDEGILSRKRKCAEQGVDIENEIGAEGQTQLQHDLREEIEMIVDLVQKVNADEIEQLRSHIERLNNQLLQHLETRSVISRKLKKREKEVAKLKLKNEEMSKSLPKQVKSTAFNLRWERNFLKYSELVGFGQHNLRFLKSTDEKLYDWAIKQRADYVKKVPTLTQDKIDKLNSIGFVWSPWDKQFQKLADYIRIHGQNAYNLIRKEDVKKDEDTSLQRWIIRQREAYASKKMTQKRIDKLNSVGFVWTRAAPYVTFEARLEQCRQFKAKHGHLSVPLLAEPNADGSVPTEEERQFRIWAQHIRRRYKKATIDKISRGKISKSEIQALDEIGFDWKLSETQHEEERDIALDRFATRVEQLKKVIEVCGTCNDKKSILTVFPNGNSLVCWVKTCRQQYHKWTRGDKTSLTPQRIKMLEDIGFDFDPRRHYAPPKTTTYKRFKGMKLENNKYRDVPKTEPHPHPHQLPIPMQPPPDFTYGVGVDEVEHHFRESPYL